MVHFLVPPASGKVYIRPSGILNRFTLKYSPDTSLILGEGRPFHTRMQHKRDEFHALCMFKQVSSYLNFKTCLHECKPNSNAESGLFNCTISPWTRKCKEYSICQVCFWVFNVSKNTSKFTHAGSNSYQNLRIYTIFEITDENISSKKLHGLLSIWQSLL